MDTIKHNHLLHSVGAGLLTALVLKNNTSNAPLIGVGVGVGLYWYMSKCGHSTACMWANSVEQNDTIYNNPRDLMNSYVATH